MPNCVRWLILVGLLAVPLRAGAQQWAADSQMFIIQGTVVDSEKKAGEIGYDAFSLSFNGKPDAKTRWLAVVGANTWNGDSFDAKETLDNIDPPNLVIDGKPALVQQLMDAPDGAHVHLEGMLVPGSGSYQLASIKVIPR